MVMAADELLLVLWQVLVVLLNHFFQSGMCLRPGRHAIDSRQGTACLGKHPQHPDPHRFTVVVDGLSGNAHCKGSLHKRNWDGGRPWHWQGLWQRQPKFDWGAEAKEVTGQPLLCVRSHICCTKQNKRNKSIRWCSVRGATASDHGTSWGPPVQPTNMLPRI